MTRKPVLTGLALLSSGIAFYVCLAMAMCGQASASQFQWYNDPNSDIDFSSDTNVTVGNTNTRGNIRPFNLTNMTLPHVGIYVPFVWPRGPNGETYPLTWNNALDGWFSPDFLTTGTSLLVTLIIVTPDNRPQLRVPAGAVASDATLSSILILNRSFNGVPETLSPDDAVPVSEISLGPDETKSIDLVFTYHWGDGRSGPLAEDGIERTTAVLYTLAPVPEPDTIVLFGGGLIVVVALAGPHRTRPFRMAKRRSERTECG